MHQRALLWPAQRHLSCECTDFERCWEGECAKWVFWQRQVIPLDVPKTTAELQSNPMLSFNESLRMKILVVVTTYAMYVHGGELIKAHVDAT